MLDKQDLELLADCACEAARSAGHFIRSYDHRHLSVEKKEGGDSLASQVVTEVDAKSQEMILEHVEPLTKRFDLAVLTEESVDDGSRFERDYFWCIDPLDGTLPFTRGQSGYAVSLALVRRDGLSVLGVVYDPSCHRMYRAVDGQGLLIDGEQFLAGSDAKKPRLLEFNMDCTFEDDPRRSQIEAEVKRLAELAGVDDYQINSTGGAVCNACLTLQQPAGIYMKPPKDELGGGCSWDFAASACLYREANGHVSDYSGEPLILNSSEFEFFNHCGVFFCSNTSLVDRFKLGSTQA